MKMGNENGKHGTWMGKDAADAQMSVKLHTRNDTNDGTTKRWNDETMERYEKTDYWRTIRNEWNGME